MDQNFLLFQTSPQVVIATNKFENVPVILKYENINLIEIVRQEKLGFTTEIPIYHSDGTYLAKVNGTRMYPTEAGKKAGVKIEKNHLVWVCKMEGKTLFEIEQNAGDSFKTTAELYTPDGHFVKCESMALGLLDINGKAINIQGLLLSNSTIKDCSVGIWIRANGSCSMGT